MKSEINSMDYKQTAGFRLGEAERKLKKLERHKRKASDVRIVKPGRDDMQRLP